LRIVVPKIVRQHIRKLHRRYVFRRAVRRLLTVPQNMDPPLNVLSDLIYGWGNEGFSAKHEYLTALFRYARNSEGPILECGSGLSTVLLGLVADTGGKKVWSLEHIPFWAEKLKTVLRGHKIKSVELCVAALRDYGAYSWYDPPKHRMPSNFSLVVCDGPPGNTPGGRYGLLPIMGSHFKPGCVILLDDTKRVSESDIISRWAGELGATYDISGSDKPFATLVVPNTG
jgi:hypothetical protein